MKINQAYRYIKRQIFEGVWEPETAINVNELSATLNISRTPIHKALSKLEQEGFITIIPQVGVYVKKPDPEEIIQRLLVCANLDSLMTEYSVYNLKEVEFAAMEKILKEMDRLDTSNDEYARLNIEFHKTIYEASKLQHTLTLTKQLWDYLNYVGNPDNLFSSKRRKRSQTEHWMIYYHLKEKDGKAAKELMERHMRRVAETVNEQYRDD